MGKHSKSSVSVLSGDTQALSKGVSIVLLVIIFLTLFSPWVYLGIKRSGGNWDVNTVVNYFEGSSLSEFLQDSVEELFYYTDRGSNSMKVRFAVRMAGKIGRNLKDSKLSLAEFSASLLELTGIAIVSGGSGSFSGGSTFALALGAIALTGLYLFILFKIIQGVVRLLRGERPRLLGILIPYAIAVVLIVFVVIAVNVSLKEDMESLMYYFQVSNPAICHLRFAPFLGLLLLGGLMFAPRFLGNTQLKTSLENINLRSVDLSAIKKVNIPVKDLLQKTEGKVGWKCKCGAYNLFSAVYCQKCGKRRPDKPTCPHCGTPLVKGSQFCHGCGARIESSAKKICPSCGKELPADATICEVCGENLDQ